MKTFKTAIPTWIISPAFIKPALLALCLLALTPAKISKGCSFEYYEDPDDLRITLFLPNLSGAERFMPFYFTYHTYYSSNNKGSDEAHAKNDSEWVDYLNHKVSVASVDTIIYNTTPNYYLFATTMLKTHNVSKKDTLAHNGFLTYLYKNHRKEDIEYLDHAKNIEEQLVGSGPWVPMDDNAFAKIKTNRDSVLQAEIKACKHNYNTVHTDFLKLRYAFQVIKAYAFLFNDDNKTLDYNELVINNYDSFIAPIKTESIIKYWALFHKGISQIRNKDSIGGNYAMMQVFDHASDWQVLAAVNLNLNCINESQKLAANAHGKATILVMENLQNPGKCLDALKKIYLLEPGSHTLGMMLVREMNKVEGWVLTPRLTGYSVLPLYSDAYKENLKDDIGYMEDLKSFVKNVIDNHNTPEPALWSLAYAHLCIMAQKYDEATQYLDMAEKENNKDEKISLQLHLCRILVAISTAPALDDAFESRIIKDIQWMGGHKNQFTFTYTANLLIYLANRYEAAGNISRAAMLRYKVHEPFGDYWYGQGDVYDYLYEKAKPEDYDQLIAQMGKEKKSAFEKYITSNKFLQTSLDSVMDKAVNNNEFQDEAYYRYGESFGLVRDLNKSRLLDYKGTWYVRHDSLEKAIEIFRTIPDTLWKREPYKYYLDARPFYVNIWMKHIAGEDTSVFSKIKFLQRIINLKKNIAAGKGDMAREYFLLGNAYFNMSYNGNSWMMYVYRWSIYDLYRYNAEPVAKNEENDIYYGEKRAQEYYLKALEATRDPKFAALCTIMLGECDQDYKYYEKSTQRKPRDYNYDNDVDAHYINPYLKTYTRKYRKKEYEKLQDCDVYLDYIARID